MTRLGIPVDRIAKRLNIDRKILSDFSDIIKPIKDDLKKGLSVPDLAKKMSFHTLFYFTRENQLVFDPMAGGGVVSDICLAFKRKCWSFDLVDRIEKRPEIEVCHWNPKNLKWPVKGKEKPDLIFIDPLLPQPLDMPFLSQKIP